MGLVIGLHSQCTRNKFLDGVQSSSCKGASDKEKNAPFAVEYALHPFGGGGTKYLELEWGDFCSCKSVNCSDFLVFSTPGSTFSS